MTYILSVVISLLSGLIIMFLIMRRIENHSLSPTDEISEQPNVSDEQLERLKCELDNVKKENDDIKEVVLTEKKKYEDIIARANQEIQKLTTALSQIKTSSETTIDIATSIDTSKLNDKISKLEKEIADLEEELEETEDSLTEERKRLKKKIEECSKLEEDNETQLKALKQKERELEEVQHELGSVRIELEEKLEEIQVKNDSLSFVQGVLIAPKVKDSDIKSLSELIDKIVIFIQGELRDCINHWKPIRNESFFKEEANIWANSRKKIWLRNKTTIAFVGEFSAGKTSIVNRILSQDKPDVPKLPVSTKATTAIPTYVTGGSKNKPLFAFLTPDNILKEIDNTTFSIVTKEVLEQVKGVSSLIKYFVLKYNNENLKDLSILDTPGFNSNDEEDAIRTIEVINECDALFWVFDVNNGTVNRSSIKTIKDNLTKPLYIVINKVDSKSKGEVDKVEQLIKQQLKDEGLQVHGFIRFSSKAPLSDIMSTIQKIQKVEEEEYIDLLNAKVNASIKIVSKECNEAKNVCDANRKNIYELDRNFEQVISVLLDDCQEVQEIPYYDPENGFLNFRDPNYKISVERKEEFDALLSKIGEEHISSLKALFRKQKPIVEESQKALEVHSDLRHTLNMLAEINEKLKKLTYQLENI